MTSLETLIAQLKEAAAKAPLQAWWIQFNPNDLLKLCAALEDAKALAEVLVNIGEILERGLENTDDLFQYSNDFDVARAFLSKYGLGGEK